MDQTSGTDDNEAGHHSSHINEAGTDCDPCPYCGQCRGGTHDVHRIPCSQVVIMRDDGNGQLEQYDFDPGAPHAPQYDKAVQSIPTNTAFTQSNHYDFDGDNCCCSQNYQSWNQCYQCPTSNCCSNPEPPPPPPPRRVTRAPPPAPTPMPSEKFSERVFQPVPSARYEPPPPQMTPPPRPPPKVASRPPPPCQDFGTSCQADVGVGGGECAGTQTFLGSEGGPLGPPGRASGVPNGRYYSAYPPGLPDRTSRVPGEYYNGYSNPPPNRSSGVPGQYPSQGPAGGRTSGVPWQNSRPSGNNHWVPSNSPVQPYYSSNFANSMDPSRADAQNFFPPSAAPSGAAGLQSGVPSSRSQGPPPDGAGGCGCCYDTTFSTPCCGSPEMDACCNGCCWWYGLVHPWNNCCCCDQPQSNSSEVQT